MIWDEHFNIVNVIKINITYNWIYFRDMSETHLYVCIYSVMFIKIVFFSQAQ